MRWTRTLRDPITSAEVWKDEVLTDGKAIYRYMRPFRLFQLLDQSCLTLASPDKWVDPFEQWWVEQLFRPGTKLNDVMAFGTCWTTQWGDEPFWRLYLGTCPCHPDDRPMPAVRIKSRVGVLLDALEAEVARTPAKTFLGMVDYSKGRDALMAEAARVRREEKSIAKVAATALHRKRPAFSYESEVRLLLIERLANPV